MGTYGYISIIAMLCYGFMLLMFLAAKRNKIINSFLVVLLGLLFWTGGSAFMRAQFWPGCEFWFQVSLRNGINDASDHLRRNDRHDCGHEQS